MNWKKRYEEKPLTTVNGYDIFKDTYHIINNGDDSCEKVPVQGGFVVKINKITKNTISSSVWFNDKLSSGSAYGWGSCYKNFYIRPATKDEIKKWKEVWKK